MPVSASKIPLSMSWMSTFSPFGLESDGRSRPRGAQRPSRLLVDLQRLRVDGDAVVSARQFNRGEAVEHVFAYAPRVALEGVPIAAARWYGDPQTVAGA